jgi:hypothetical protein
MFYVIATCKPLLLLLFTFFFLKIYKNMGQKLGSNNTNGKGKSESEPTRDRDIKCLGKGHIASQCPNRRGNWEVKSESDRFENEEMISLGDCSDDANLVITWSRNPHAKTPIPGKPSKSGLIGV